MISKTPHPSGGVAVHCNICGAGARAVTQQGVDEFSRSHAHQQPASQQYLGLGTVIANGLKRLGAKPCAPCAARAAALDRLAPKVWPRR